MMRRFRRSLRKHSGITARRVAVRSHQPWYRRLLLVLALLLAGYALGYWQFGHSPEKVGLEQLQSENRTLQQGLVHLEQQSQVDRAAQRNLASQMAALQAEGMRLKKEVAFYESILQDSEANGEPRIHSVRLSPGARSGEYRYEILLTQTGRRDKPVQGTLRLLLLVDGRAVSQPITSGLPRDGKINFKYYQRVDGSFVVPEPVAGQRLQVEFTVASARQQKLVKSVNFPD